MNILCFGCRRSMGTTNVEPTEEVKVWYGLDPQCELFLSLGERAELAQHVEKQNKLPELPGKEDGVHIHPPV